MQIVALAERCVAPLQGISQNMEHKLTEMGRTAIRGSYYKVLRGCSLTPSWRTNLIDPAELRPVTWPIHWCGTPKKGPVQLVRRSLSS